ncbi:MAG: peroxiredoxin [Lysobacter sp.]|nr:MAG: peroxiredoxin [Lysobacter sp.]
MTATGKALPKTTLKHSFALSDGTAAALADFAGRWVVLYFYPKDSTPGCTTEGLEFNALLPKFEKLGCDVLGVSRDSIKSHQNFCEKQGFKFPLISDADETLCNAFDVIQEKNMYGKKVLGIVRSTFLIDPDGKLTAEWRGVKVAGHAQAVLDALKAAQAK